MNFSIFYSRRYRFFFVPFLCMVISEGVSACHSSPSSGSTRDPVDWVDPFIGTGGIPWTSGMLFPGATAPFGMVRLSPDTSYMGGLVLGWGTAGYYYGQGRVLGFSHTRLSGTGATDGGQFRITPAVGQVDPALRLTRPARLDKSSETATPGYYAVRLSQPDVEVELTSTTRVGLHRYTFAPGAEAHLLLDATSFPIGERAEEGWVEVLPDAREVVGSGRVFGSFSGRWGGLKGYFVARFSRTFDGYGTWLCGDLEEERAEVAGDDVGADLRFSGGPEGAVVEVKLGVSFVSLANARANLEAEAGALDFDGVHAAARQVWEDALGLIRIETDDSTVREIFYTALYHCMIMPTNFTDLNGEYLGFEHQVGVAEGFTYYTDLSLWDTFRSEHPLLALIAPEVQRDSIKSLIRMARIGGSLPRWPSGAGYTGSMLGSPADMVIAESYLKGITDFEAQEAYEYMRATALGETAPGVPGRSGIEECLEFGFCPSDRMSGAVSRTVEYAWADASVALMAEALGHADDAELFRERSLEYRLTWNPLTRHFQPRNADSTWLWPFFPNLTTYYDELFGTGLVNDYVEGSPRHWRWVAPHDPEGLVALFGGPDYFVSELETFMDETAPVCGAPDPGPAYWHGNQHDMHAIYLFNEAGRPDLTQKWVRWALTDRYGTGPDGLDGNDDGGTLSAWYVLSAIGLYPIAGTDQYWVGAPIVDRADVSLGGGATLTVIAENQGPENIYVQEARVNGERLCAPFLRHAWIAQGGTLAFEMGPASAPGGGFECR